MKKYLNLDYDGMVRRIGLDLKIFILVLVFL